MTACISIGEWTGYFATADRTIIIGDGRPTSEVIAKSIITHLNAKPMPTGADLTGGIYFQMGFQLFEIYALLDTLIAAREKLIAAAKANPPPAAADEPKPSLN